MNAMQGQQKSTGDLFNDGREVGFGAKSLPDEYRKWEIQLDGLMYTAV
jgi:hypothetical protein